MSSPADFLNDIGTVLADRTQGIDWAFGAMGYSRPRFPTEPILIPAEDAERLAAYGIAIEGDAGRDNLICIERDQPPLSLAIRLSNCTGTRIAIGKGAPFSGRFAFNGDDSLLVVAGMGAMGGASTVRMTFAPGGAAYLGLGMTSVSSDWIIEGAGACLVIGDDLMASWNVAVRNFDSHALFDLAERRVINRADNLHIGPHCWLGQDARILRGVRVGAGSVIGAGAIVVGEVPRASAVAGSPARVVRSGVSWTRAAKPSEKEMQRVSDLIGADKREPSSPQP